MSKVEVKEHITKRIESSNFNFLASTTGYDVNILYKMGLIPTYQRSLTISVEDMPKLIEVLVSLQQELSKSNGEK